jgi:protein-tyrosine-phosphatase
VAHAKLIVSMGCGDQCPVVLGAEHLEWELSDPKGQPVENVRRIRDQVREQVRGLVESRHWGRQTVNA